MKYNHTRTHTTMYIQHIHARFVERPFLTLLFLLAQVVYSRLTIILIFGIGRKIDNNSIIKCLYMCLAFLPMAYMAELTCTFPCSLCNFVARRNSPNISCHSDHLAGRSEWKFSEGLNLGTYSARLDTHCRHVAEDPPPRMDG